MDYDWKEQQPYAYWLAGVEGLGNKSRHELVEYMGTPRAVFETEKEWKELLPEKKVKLLEKKKREADIEGLYDLNRSYKRAGKDAFKTVKLVEEIQAVVKEYSNIKKTTQAAQVQYKENAEKYNALKESVKGEKESVENELNELKAKVDPELMERYLKKRANKIYPVLFEVKGNVCGACRMELPMSEMNKLKNGGVIDCDQCGRLLYLGE